MTTEIEKLGATINSRIQKVVTGRSQVIAEIGTITAGGNLKVPSLSNNIPSGDFVRLKPEVTISEIPPSGDSEEGSGGGQHVDYSQIEAGASVLVIWVNSIPIVMGELE